MKSIIDIEKEVLINKDDDTDNNDTQYNTSSDYEEYKTDFSDG